MKRVLAHLLVGLAGLGIALVILLAPHPLAALGIVPVLLLLRSPPMWLMQSSFASLWFVRVEPAPTDLLLASGLSLLFLRGSLIIRPTPLILLTGAYALLNVVQILLPGSSAFYSGITVYLCLLTIGVAALPAGDVDGLLPAYHLSAVITAAMLLGLGLLFYADRLPEALIPWVTDSGRVSGLFKDPNVAAPFVASTWIYVAERYLTSGRAGMLVLWFALVPSLIVPFSRGALLFAVVALAILLGIHLRANPRRVLGMGLLAAALGSVAALAIVPLFHEIGQSRFLQVQTRYDSDRRGAWEGGIEASSRHPVGVGPGATKDVMTEFHPMSIQMNTHQTYLQVLTENGVLGLVLFVGILVMGLVNAWKRRFSGGGWVFAALFGLVVESFVVDTLHWRLLWILLALSAISPAASDLQGEREHATADGDTAHTRRCGEVGMASIGRAPEPRI